MSAGHCDRHPKYLAGCAQCQAISRDYLARRRRAAGTLSWAEYVAARRSAARGRSHGRISTYNHGCRCSDCREAARLARARHRALQKEAS